MIDDLKKIDLFNIVYNLSKQLAIGWWVSWRDLGGLCPLAQMVWEIANGWGSALSRVMFLKSHAFHSRFPTRHAPMQMRTGSDAAGAWTCIHLHCAHGAFLQLAGIMQSLISPVTKAILVALFIFAILLILYVILWYICRDVDCDHGIWLTLLDASLRTCTGCPNIGTDQQGSKGWLW